MSWPCHLSTYLSWASTSAFSLGAYSATCFGMRLVDMMALEWRVGVLGRGGVGTVVLGGTVWPCCAAGRGWLKLECGTVVLLWHGVAVLQFWLGTAGNFVEYVFRLFLWVLCLGGEFVWCKLGQEGSLSSDTKLMYTNLDKIQLKRMLQGSHRLVEMETQSKMRKSRLWIIKWPFKG